MISLTTPLTVEKIKTLRAGDEVLLSGTIYTGRDAAHKRLLELHQQGKDLPISLEDQTIFYVGPTPSKPGQIFGSGGPTTSGRMDAYSPTFIGLGMRAMIGKGYRNQEVKEALVKHGVVYFGAIGGSGATISSCVVGCEIVAFEDLGPEAIRKLEIKDMPLVVIIDSIGNDQYKMGRENYLTTYK
ncbi:MAG: Fe-S-containing hydro-lyase [Coprobacillaceae bacterium]